MSDNKSSYRQIIKASSILGGAQVINIFLGFIRTKFVAVLLGAPGIGIIGLLNSPLGLITSITGLGINYSAIRDISEAASTGDQERIARTRQVVQRWVLFTGTLGMLITMFLAPWLSDWTFGNSDFTLTYVLLSTTLLINAIDGGQKAFLQGIRRLKSLAKTNIYGTVVGLLTSVPVYYIWGVKGIPFAILIIAAANMVVSWHFTSKIYLPKTSLSLSQVYYQGSKMVKIGIMLSVSGIIGMAVRYIINAYIGREGSLEQVGLFQAGFAFINMYVGMVFSAMGSDFYPRLASINTNNEKCIEAINNQITVAITILTPICAILLTFLPLAVKLVYSSSFIDVVPMGHWLILSVFFKIVVWALGYLYLAKGALKTAFILDNIINVVFLIGYISFYEFFGLEGLGVADLAMYLIALPLTYIISRKKYGFYFSREALVQLLKYGVLLFVLFATVKIVAEKEAYVFGSILSLVIVALSLKDLNNQIGLFGYLKNKLSKYDG